MNPATMKVLKKAISIIGKEAYAYIKDDQLVSYSLLQPAYIRFSGKDIGIGNWDNGILKIVSKKGGDEVCMYASPFSGSLRLWNGPDLIPNRDKKKGKDGDGDGRMEASLWHDLIWFFSPFIAKDLELSEQDVLAWANGLLPNAWKGYAEWYPDARFVKTKAHLGYNATELGRPVYHPFKRFVNMVRGWFLLAIVASLLAGCEVGCKSAPEWKMEEASPVEYEKYEPEQVAE